MPLPEIEKRVIAPVDQARIEHRDQTDADGTEPEDAVLPPQAFRATHDSVRTGREGPGHELDSCKGQSIKRAGPTRTRERLLKK
ncbi:hypothetical protein OKW31_002143 [Paraburkholderia atlantica]|uniref:hypothetical protein n=1 Tax=Paraburkholderia atlantica TaxID=2654982 RepID=UPI003D21C939